MEKIIELKSVELIDILAFNNNKNLVIGRDMKGLRSLAL